MTTKQARRLSDSLLLSAEKEALSYLGNPGLDAEIAREYRAALDVIRSEIRRREI